MKNINEFLQNIGFEVAAFIGGIAGAFVSTSKKKKSFLERLTAVLSGGLIANYLTPVFIAVLPLGEGGDYGMAFILGFMGMSSVEFVIDYLQGKFDKSEELKD